MQTAKHTALLILINIAHYSDETGKKIYRARFSENSIRRMSARQRLREAFIRELTDQLLDLGWCFFCLQDGNGYGIVNTIATDKWPGLGTKRISEEGFYEMSEEDLQEELNVLLNKNEDDEF